MPVINIPIAEVDATIVRPVVFALLEQVKLITNIPQDTPVIYIGQGNQHHQLQGKTSPNEAPVTLGSDRRLVVEVEEIPSESLFLTNTVNQPHHIPDFLDRDLGIELKPSYAGFEYQISVVYRTPSRAEAVRWRNDARLKASQTRLLNLHELEYKYQIPYPVFMLLRHLHELRNQQGGDGMPFDEYFTRSITTRAVQMSNLVGDHPEVMIREKAIRVQGFFDFTVDPRRQEKSEGHGWEVQFMYTVEFSKPVEFSMRYPLVVHNQPIDMQFVPLAPESSYEQDKRMAYYTDALYFMEEPVYLNRHTNIEPIKYTPAFDEWKANQAPPRQRVIASFLLGLKEDQREPLLNLKNLGDYFLDPDILEWLEQAEYRYMHLPWTSAVQVHLYRNECLSSSYAIEVNENLDVILKEPVNIKKRYRIVLSLTEGLQYCDPKSLKRLARFPKAMCKIIKYTNSTTGHLHSLLPHVNLGEFAHCAAEAGRSRKEVLDNIVSLKTVMRQGIVAQPIEKLSEPLPEYALLQFRG